jgi:hypothetical protein
MSNNIVVDDSVKISVKFIDIDSNGDQVEVEVDSVELEISKSDGTLVAVDSGDIIPITVGSTSGFYYIFTPTEADTYTVKYTGIYYVGLTEKQIVVEQKLYVSSTTEDYYPTVVLGSNETITFASEISPLYLDPESLLAYFPDATLLEIAEIIYNYSLEVKSMYNLTDSEDGSGLSFNVLEYIKAATACELTRTYGYGGDDEVSLHLGDFTVTNSSVPRKSVTRDNATTWCQIATALRKEMLATKVGAMAMQPKGLPTIAGLGSSGKQIDPETGKVIYLSDRELYGPGRRVTPKDDPMPRRGLRSYD